MRELRASWAPLVCLMVACGAPVTEPDDAGSPVTDAGVADAGAHDAGEFDAGIADAGVPDAGTPDAGTAAVDAGFPNVDRSMPQLYPFQFTAAAADPDAGRALGNEVAALDTRVPSLGLLVVYLHGAGAPSTCGSTTHENFLAARGFHVVGPCYVSDYGVGICGNDIGGCRLEAFDGIDHTSVIAIAPADSIEVRVVQMLKRLQTLNPKGDWQFFIDDTGKPRWNRIVISGISHGASTAGLIAKVRPVTRSVMLSGPLDTGQAWLTQTSLTPSDRLWAFTHSLDPQHAGHLAAFIDLQLPGTPQRIELGARPWNDSHRLFTSVDAGDPHGSTQAGSASPRAPDGGYLFGTVWEQLYTAP